MSHKTKEKFTNSTSTDLLYEYFADPSKLKPIKQAVKIVKNDLETENAESFMVDHSNIKKEHLDLKFRDERLHSIVESKHVSPTNSSKKLSQNSVNKSSSHKGKIPYDKSLLINSEKKIDKDISKEKNELIERRKYYAKILELKTNKCELCKEYTMDSPIEDMKAEIKYQYEIKGKKQGINLAKRILGIVIDCVELTNNKFDPFGFNLDGWSQDVTSQLNDPTKDYDYVFERLIEKYRGDSGELAPEIQLGMLLIGSAASRHIQNTILGGNVNKAVKEQPNLINKLMSSVIGGLGNNPKNDAKDTYKNVKQMYDKKIKESTIKENAISNEMIQHIQDKFLNKTESNKITDEKTIDTEGVQKKLTISENVISKSSKRQQNSSKKVSVENQ